MTCEHPTCSFHIFSTCTNHCTQNVCLEHLIEHGDIFLRDYTSLLDQLAQSTDVLTKEIDTVTVQITHRRDDEVELIKRKYDEEQQNIRKQLAFAEKANQFFLDKRQQLIHAKEKIAQHDLEQLKSYTNQMQAYLFDEPPLIHVERPSTTSKTCSCPLIQPNIFGIIPSHQIRLDCDGSIFNRYTLVKHFESYHRMLPECAIRLRDGIFYGQSTTQTKLFSENEIIRNEEYLVDCPLIDVNNIYGAREHIQRLMHIPCTKKQLTIPSMLTHLTLYHKMKYDVAKKIFLALKTKSLHSDLILFETDQRLAVVCRRK